jgi:hypothetical protein|tara:strand:- start:1007 stop:1210 length:204 start_codon:yes stop_codon:yes gene_type:complete
MSDFSDAIVRQIKHIQPSTPPTVQYTGHFTLKTGKQTLHIIKKLLFSVSWLTGTVSVFKPVTIIKTA